MFFWIIIFITAVFLYSYFRLGEGNPVRNWIDANAIYIGHGFIVVWVIYFFLKDPKLGVFYGLPMLIIVGITSWKKYKSKR
jgi:hypothetical protein